LCTYPDSVALEIEDEVAIMGVPLLLLDGGAAVAEAVVAPPACGFCVAELDRLIDTEGVEVTLGDVKVDVRRREVCGQNIQDRTRLFLSGN
jgi:hypothetical protein